MADLQYADNKIYEATPVVATRLTTPMSCAKWRLPTAQQKIRSSKQQRGLTMQLKLNEAKDQSELDSILSTVKRKFESSDRGALVLCDVTKDYPWRTVRSRVNGARLFIEKNGQWKEPTYAILTEQILADYPRLTEKELDEMEEAFGF